MRRAIFIKDVIISDKPWDINRADKIILPGVGHFRSAIDNIKRLGLFEALIEGGKNKPFLGICLGMQLLFSESEEGNEDCGLKEGNIKGLSILSGKVVRFLQTMKVPHIGWNRVSFNNHPIFNAIPENPWFYFAHSYYPVPDGDVTIGRTNYKDIEFASVVSKDNIIGCQFHPEKSGKIGLNLIENFVRL